MHAKGKSSEEYYMRSWVKTYQHQSGTVCRQFHIWLQYLVVESWSEKPSMVEPLLAWRHQQTLSYNMRYKQYFSKGFFFQKPLTSKAENNQ